MPEFRNPNAGGSGGGQDNRSFLLMMIVLVGVIFGVQYWRGLHNPQTAAPSTHPAAVPAASAPSASAPSAPAAPSSTPFAASQPAPAPGAALGKAAKAAPATPTVQGTAETSTIVENELYRITFSNRGGQVTSWILKKYHDSEGKPLDLVHNGAAEAYGFPMSLYTYDPGLTKALASALYVPSATGTLQAPATLSFHYAANGYVVEKTFTFAADYVIHADTFVTHDGAPVRSLLAWAAGLGDMTDKQEYDGAQIDLMQNGKDSHIAYKKISGGNTETGSFDFAAASDQYFAAALMPDAPADATVVEFHHDLDVNKVHRKVGQGVGGKGTLVVPVLGVAAGDVTGHTLERIFVGPKAMPVLKSLTTADGHSLEPLLDFGFWGPVGKYLFLGLQFVHHLIAPNSSPSPRNYSWGWAIIIFTIFINLILLPLRIQSMRSALKMQRIQPQIDAIKAKYKKPKATDPKMQEMNAEVMAYQKEQGVSMFGGCIPSLVQMPLLFAFFTMMTKVVELRQAHFFWLPDLSAADPWHILPILMIATSFLVQFYTPSPGVDPQQQRMLAFMMPAFSGFLTWNYASGLALYWNVGNVIMIIQQAVMNRTSLGKEIREIQAKRARRKAGASGQRVPAKTIQGRR